MFERGLDTECILQAIEHGELISDYPDDNPYPSCLLLYFSDTKPVHVLVARNEKDYACYVVTAYIPDRKLWSDNFKVRKQP